MTTVNVFIPRVGLNVNFDIMSMVFRHLNIGTVISADFHRKKLHQYVFVAFQIYEESSYALYFQDILEKEGKRTIHFAETTEVWEVKRHIPFHIRNKPKELTKEIDIRYKVKEEPYPEIVMSVFNYLCI
jgi:hypothetical protein